jgi:hypothetical protein
VLGLDGKQTAAMLDPDMDAAHQETQVEAIEAAFNPLGPL